MRAVRVVQLLFFNLHFPRFVICSNLSSSKNVNFPWLSRTKIKFRDFPGLENEILRFHDFPGFPWHVRTLLPHFTVAQNRGSVLTAVDKIFEQLICKQLSEKFEPIFDTFLSAYRKHFSCETTLIRLTEPDWKHAADKGHASVTRAKLLTHYIQICYWQS